MGSRAGLEYRLPDSGGAREFCDIAWRIAAEVANLGGVTAGNADAGRHVRRRFGGELEAAGGLAPAGGDGPADGVVRTGGPAELVPWMRAEQQPAEAGRSRRGSMPSTKR